MKYHQGLLDLSFVQKKKKMLALPAVVSKIYHLSLILKNKNLSLGITYRRLVGM
jgi:hypothetical protein